MTAEITHLPGTSRGRSDQPHNVVDSRELIAVQTFDVARLTTHAIPIVPGTFIAVSGVGPKGDSNGSGKTSFLAAITVLLAEPQWRLEVNGGYLAAGLLFKPTAAGLEASHVSPAPHGYVVGVFADPSDPAGTDRSLLTVWVRLATSSPHLQVRWTPGLQVADGDTDDQRYEQADRIWASIPPSQRCSARQMQAVLYGDAPRCMAYLDTPLRRTTASLLSQQMTEMTPETIGQSLIDLTGLRPMLDDEQEQRNVLAEQQRQQSDAETFHERRLRDEDAELTAVANRQRARTALGRGGLMWRLHFARRYVDIVPEHEAATRQVDDAASALAAVEAELTEATKTHDQLASQREPPEAEHSARNQWEEAQVARGNEEMKRAVLADQRRQIAADRPRLRNEAEGWDGTPAAEHEQSLDHAREEASNARARHDLLREEVDHATAALRQVEEGTPPDVAEAMSALTASELRCAALADTLTIDESDRAGWEPMIHPWLSAVVVPPGDLERAVTAVSHLPGTILITADSPPIGAGQRASADGPPDGVQSGIPIGGFLRAIASRHDLIDDPPRAVDGGARITVIGGFGAAVAGREARIAAARLALASAEAQVADAARIVQQSALRERYAAAMLQRAISADELARNDEEARRLDSAIHQCEERIETLKEAETVALERWQAAQQRASDHHNLVDGALRTVERVRDRVLAATSALKSAQSERDSLHLAYWRDGWGGTVEQAGDLLAEQDEAVQRLTAKRLRNRAQEALKEALDHYGADVRELPSDIRDVADHRDDLADGDDPSPGSLTFLELSRPLQTRLDGTADRDATTETTIRVDRDRRRHSLETLREEVRNRSASLEAIQDMIERSVEGHFGRMSGALNTLDLNRDGYGAELHVVSRRPESATSAWRWQVSPRWRRTRDGNMIDYREVANGAQVKVYAIQVTLAALLSADSTTGRVLVIDELGNSLGEVNREDVLREFRQVAERQHVTILGACQDSVLHDAAQVCQEILWFTHASTVDAYNQPVRIWAHDQEQRRVELTADWTRSFRPWM